MSLGMDHKSISTPGFHVPVPVAFPPRAGIGLKARHYAEIIETAPDIGWFEFHSENYLCDGGPTMRWLDKLREMYPLSMHGVGLSLGSAGPLDKHHLKRLAQLQSKVEPIFVSEHLSWSVANGNYLNDLIALPYTEESLDIFCTHVDEMQNEIGRKVIIENPSSYLRYTHSTINEADFLLEVINRTECGLLLDVNNVYVSAKNHGFDPISYINKIPVGAVSEMHLAGHSLVNIDGRQFRIDDHGARVDSEVWKLFAHTVSRLGPAPTLIEWDSNVPELSVLLEEAAKADAILTNASLSIAEDRHAAVG